MRSSEGISPPAAHEIRVHRFEVFKACVYFSIASTGMLLANKGVVLALKSPWLLALCQNLVSCVFFLCMFKMKAKSSASQLLVQHSVKWIPAVLLFSVNIITSMLSLSYISIATFSVLRNLNPLFSSVLSYVMFREKTANSALIALVAILAGSILYAFHDLDFQLTGYAVCLAHVASMSLYSCVVKYLSQKLEPLEMSILNNVLSIPVVAIISFSLGELQSVRVQLFFAQAFGGGATTLYFSCSCILGCCISITAFTCQSKMSATAFLTLNNCNKIPAILISSLLFHGHISILSIVGLAFSLAGGYFFALASVPDSQADVFNFFGSIATQTRDLLTVRRHGIFKRKFIWFAFLLIWLLNYALFVIPLVTKITSKNYYVSTEIFGRKRLQPKLFHLQNISRTNQFTCDIFNPSISFYQSVSGQVKAGLQNGIDLSSRAPVSSSTLPASQPRLCYDRVLNTGFGDRLSVYLTVAAAAATVSAEVYTFWEHEPIAFPKCFPTAELNHTTNRSDVVPPSTMACDAASSPGLCCAMGYWCPICNVSFDRIQQYVIWPPNLKIFPKEQYNERKLSCGGNIQFNIPGLLPSYFAFDAVYSLAWKTMMLPEPLPTLQLHNFVESYRQVAKQLKINISKHPMLEDQKYVVLHVRGGDKLTNHSHFNTFDILHQLPHGMPIIVVTDSVEHLPFIIPNTDIQILTSSTKITHLNSSEPFSSLRIFRFPTAAERYEGIMQDFDLLLGATGIIQHSKKGWSSYSSVAAMVSAVPLLNTWITSNSEDNSSKYVGESNVPNVLAGFDSNGGVPAELKSAQRKEDVRVFMDMMFCEWDAFIARLQSFDFSKIESKKILL